MSWYHQEVMNDAEEELRAEMQRDRDARLRLNEAAPEMMKALEQVAAALPNGKWSFLPAVRAAIAKARGEEADVL